MSQEKRIEALAALTAAYTKAQERLLDIEVTTAAPPKDDLITVTTAPDMQVSVGVADPGKIEVGFAHRFPDIRDCLSAADRDKLRNWKEDMVVDMMLDTLTSPEPPPELSPSDRAVHNAIRAMRTEPHGNRMGAAQWIEEEP